MKNLREKMLQEMQRRNYSSRTIKTYISGIVQLSKYYNQSPDCISIAEVKTFLHHLVADKKRSASTINQIISAVKILHQGVLGRDWNTLKIARTKRNKKLPVILTQEEVIQLIQSATNIKHKVILMLGYSAGLRISEVIHLKVAHIDSKRMQIRVIKGKGNKDRNTILSTALLETLRSYYRIYQPKEWLFEGASFSKKPYYSKESINKIIKKAAQKINLSKSISFHTLRHCFATHLLEQNTSLQVIQKLMGHSSITSTSVYLHVQEHSLNVVVSPLDYKL